MVFFFSPQLKERDKGCLMNNNLKRGETLLLSCTHSSEDCEEEIQLRPVVCSSWGAYQLPIIEGTMPSSSSKRPLLLRLLFHHVTLGGMNERSSNVVVVAAVEPTFSSSPIGWKYLTIFWCAGGAMLCVPGLLPLPTGHKVAAALNLSRSVWDRAENWSTHEISLLSVIKIDHYHWYAGW